MKKTKRKTTKATRKDVDRLVKMMQTPEAKKAARDLFKLGTLTITEKYEPTRGTESPDRYDPELELGEPES